MRTFVLAILLGGAAAAQHAGISAELAYHLRENLAAQLGLWYFPVSVQSTLSEELLTKARVAPETAEALLLLRPSTDPATGRTFGDSGYRPIASLGIGLRAFLSQKLTLRLELRDFLYSGYVSRVNGCNRDDVSKIETAEAAGQTATGLSGGCDERAFGPPGTQAQLNAGAAKDLLARPSADVINNLAFQGGLSWLF